MEKRSGSNAPAGGEQQKAKRRRTSPSFNSVSGRQTLTDWRSRHQDFNNCRFNGNKNKDFFFLLCVLNFLQYGKIGFKVLKNVFKTSRRGKVTSPILPSVKVSHPKVRAAGGWHGFPEHTCGKWW